MTANLQWRFPENLRMFEGIDCVYAETIMAFIVSVAYVDRIRQNTSSSLGEFCAKSGESCD